MINPTTFLKPGPSAFLILAAGLLFCPIQAKGQQVQGVVFDRETRQRVVGASVMLLDTTFAVVAGTTANQTGAFRVAAEEPGSFFVLTEALGYRPTLDGIL